MIDPALLPTRLVSPGERPPMQDVAAVPQARGRGWLTLRRMSGWLLRMVWLRVTGRLTPVENARQLTRLLEELGGLWIKAGQLLSLRVDLFSDALCRELATLQTRGAPFAFADAKRILEEALEAPIERYFVEFEERPFATTWNSQVHRARLARENLWVAVKILRPGTQEIFARDLAMMTRVSHVLARVGTYRSVRWEDGLAELRQVAREEADLRYEAAAAERLRKNLPDQKILVPEVFHAYGSRNVFVSEFIHAALMSDLVRLRTEDPERLARWLAANDIDPNRLARRLIFSFLRQLFEDNFYHGDLHPGNIVLLRGNRVAFLHFGSCTFTEREYLQKLRLFFRALASRDYGKAADLCFLLSGQLPAIDIEAVKTQVVRGLRTWATRTFVAGLSYHEKSIDQATIVVTRTLFQHGCAMDWAFLRVRRALTVLDASLVHLYPEVNYTQLCSRYFRKADRRALAATLGRPLVTRTLAGVSRALDLQERLSEYSLFQGGIIRRHAQVFQGATDKLSELVAMLLGQCVLLLGIAAAFLVAIIIEQRAPGSLHALLGRQVSALVTRMTSLDAPLSWGLLALDALTCWALLRLRRRFLEKDVRLPTTQASV
jgi:ubiquinone biosynthesis protein